HTPPPAPRGGRTRTLAPATTPRALRSSGWRVRVFTMALYSSLSLPTLICCPCLLVRPAFMMNRIAAMIPSTAPHRRQPHDRAARPLCFAVVAQGLLRKARPGDLADRVEQAGGLRRAPHGGGGWLLVGSSWARSGVGEKGAPEQGCGQEKMDAWLDRRQKGQENPR